MKKSLISLVILSTLTVSNLAMAVDVRVGSQIAHQQNITITGRVDADASSCLVNITENVRLGTIKVSDFDDISRISNKDSANVSINLTDCSVGLINGRITATVGSETMTNIDLEGSNVGVAVLNNLGAVVNLTENVSYNFVISPDTNDASLSIPVNYIKPEGDAVTPGNVAVVLPLSIMVSDGDII
ncbi:fimbrial protein [Proteus hauseri]|uniref:fimbrial protein n=1 Tax=Proteus hauseri TaxID=183417 RepID=UPI0010095BC4|nr:fimbrial protein [Proteus hauseri]QAV24755.1 hypothetical protein PH4a_16000 [Proteus hauseri]